jgi:type VI secretion system protein ImpF
MEPTLPRDRLQPCLLDRLTDTDRAHPGERREQRVWSQRQLHAFVLRDLQWLLNTPCRFAPEELKDFPLAARSIINYGLPNLTGAHISGLAADRLERLLVTAIQSYEPRVLRRSLVVLSVGEGASNLLQFEIKGEIWADPVPDVLYVKTELDLETGRCVLRDQQYG